MSVVVKALLVLVSASALHHAGSPPHARPPHAQLREQVAVEHWLPRLAGVGRITAWAWALTALTALLAHPISPAASRTTPTALTAPFVAGTALIVAGGALRAQCYRALGSAFTFELSIRPSHTLVTGGVYGAVRHPSYAGGLLLVLGWALCVLDLRPWASVACAQRLPGWAWAWAGALGWEGQDADCDTVVTSAFVCVLATLLGGTCLASLGRMDREDAMLEEHFGDTWRAWAKRVPYRLVPGVY